MQVIATKTGSELKLTKREKSLLEDCKAFAELLGKHGDDSMQEDAAKAVGAINRIQLAFADDAADEYEADLPKDAGYEPEEPASDPKAKRKRDTTAA